MARLGVLRTNDVRCLSATFFVVVIICCVFLLALQPPQLPNKISMIDLPRDEVLRSDPVSAKTGLALNGNETTGGEVAGKKGGKVGEEQDKKEKKAKWFKDELPGSKDNPGKGNAALRAIQEAETQGPLHSAEPRGKRADTANTDLSPAQDIASSSPASSKERNLLAKNNAERPKPDLNLAYDLGVAHDTAPLSHASNDGGRKQASGTNKAELPVHEQESKRSDSDAITKTDVEEILEFVPDDHIPLPKPARGQIFDGGASLISNLDQSQLSSFSSPFIGADKEIFLPQVEKKIITWHHIDEASHDLTRMRRALEQCPEAACEVTYPMPPGDIADAIIVDKIDTVNSVPIRLTPDQAFVFHAMSSPARQPETKEEWSQPWNTAFNWTWSYRRDSDIWQPFGMLTQAVKVRPQEYFAGIAKSKTRPLVWMPETCFDDKDDAPSQRQQFVAALRRYLPITEFGSCVNRTCFDKGKGGRISTNSASCSSMLTKKFFFLLALEDDLCRDHVTDIFYRAWRDGTHVVPVVRGGADYAAYFPEGSYVDVDWFDTVQDLADFLSEMIRSRKLYAQLLWRKAHWISSGKRLRESGLCHLCFKLHHLHTSRKRYPDMRRWYEKGVCRVPRPIS